MGDADRLIGGMRALGDTLQVTFGNMANNLEWVDPVVIALDGSPYCHSNRSAAPRATSSTSSKPPGTTAPSRSLRANCSRLGRYRTCRVR